MTQQEEQWEIVKHFAQVAERFCALVDSMASLERTAFLLQVYRLLPELINEAVRLPLMKSEDDGDDGLDDDPSKFVASIRKQARPIAPFRHEDWATIYHALNEKLQDWNTYWQVFDPTDDADHEPIYGTLADDITGIYQDLKEGLLLLENPESPAEDIIFHWQVQFQIHWGRHAMEALHTLHFRLQDELEGFNQPD